MAFTTPTLPIRSGTEITTIYYSPDSLYVTLDAVRYGEAVNGLVPYFADHPLMLAAGLTMNWGDGATAVQGGGSTRPASGFLYPRGN